MRLTGIGTDRLDAEAQDIALDQKFDGIGRRSWSMGAILAAVRIAIDVALRPVGAEQHPAASRGTTMLRFPVLDMRVAQQEVGIDRAFGGEVEHPRGSDKLLRGDLVNAIVGKIRTAERRVGEAGVSTWKYR